MSVKTGIELTSRDLFDRIINLKFTRASKRTFIIRSDYEPVFYKDGTIGFKKCVQKPDIKVSYKHVSATSSIEVEIEIKNFQIAGADSVGQEFSNNTEITDAEGLISSYGGDPVESCIIQMGYRAQFPDWTDEDHRNNIDQYYDLNNSAVVSSGFSGEVKYPQQINVDILAAYPTGYPPDRTMFFKGTIGGFDTGLRWEHTADDLVAGFGESDVPEGLSEIEAYLFEYVTRRFVRSGITHKQKTTKTRKTGDNVSILDKYAYTQTVEIKYGLRWLKIALGENGLMAIDDAKKYGVECHCSQRLRSMDANALYGYGLTEEQAGAMPPIPPVPFDDLQETAIAQINALQQHFPALRWYLLNNGNYFFYHKDETDKELWTDAFVKEQQREAVILPAVYDITPVGVRTIRCPFISWVNPTTTVIFRSRFSKGAFTGYFYPVRTKAFGVITADIKFATVGDDNEMSMVCTDIPEEDAPIIDTETGEIVPKPSKDSDKTPELSKLQQGRYLYWIEKTLDVVKHKTGATNTSSRWANIVEQELEPTFRPENWPEGQVYTEELALAALKDWNPDYFDPDGKYMKRNDSEYGESIENAPVTGIGGRTGIKVPWLKAGEDLIVVRYPFQADYPEDQKVIV
jgi:hypothetical protein